MGRDVYKRQGPDGLRALIFWGDYSYGTYDTRFTIERYVELDERWLFALAKDPEGKKPAVTWQTYNRGGVLYGSYDEMLILSLIHISLTAWIMVMRPVPGTGTALELSLIHI